MTSTPQLFSGLASESTHWYSQDGTPAYEITGANGKQRAVTLRDARKLQLCPGFSSIARLEDKPALTQWKINQALMAALTLPRISGETLEQFKGRCELDMEAQSKAARERGTALHAALEAWYEYGTVSDENAPYVMPVVQWLSDKFPNAPWGAEKSFVHSLGYGGKTDLYAPGVALVDFKFKDFSDPAKVKGYDEHEMQLHAYSYGLGDNQAQLVNLFISSTVPGLIVPVVWPWREQALMAFIHLLKFWQCRKGYAPDFSVGVLS